MGAAFFYGSKPVMRCMFRQRLVAKRFGNPALAIEADTRLWRG